MAANFGASSTNVEPMGSSASPQAGIVDEPVFIQGVSDVFGQVGDMLKSRKEGKNQTAISNFTKQQLLVADGVAQGRYKSAYAQTLLRQNLLNAIDSNSNLTSEFVKAQASIMGLAGGGKIAVDGTEDEQREKARRDQLTTAGLVATGASDSEFKKADTAARLAVAAAERHKQRTATLQAERDAISTTKARREEIEAQLESENNRMVADSSEAEILRVRSEFDKILTSGIPESEMEIAITDFYTEWQAQTAAVLGNTKSSTRDVLQGVFDNMKDDYLKRARGEYGDAELTRRLARGEQQRTALLMADPQVAAMATISKVFGSESITQMMVTDPRNDGIDSFMRFIAGGGSDAKVEQPSVFTDDRATKIGMDQYFKDLSRTLTSNDAEAVAEGRDHITSLLASIEDDSGRIARDPKKAIALVDWLASPSFLKARNANPEAFENLEGVTSVLNQNYHDEVRGMVDSEFKKANVFVRSKTPTRTGQVSEPTSELVEAVGTDGGMTFQPIDTNNRDSVKEAARLNKVLKPIINNSLKAQAHLEGRTDYKVIWEGAAELMLGVSGGAGEDQLAGGDAGDDLTMDDFAKGIASVAPLEGSEVNVIESGLPSGGTMKKVSGMVLHHTGGRGTVDTVVNVLKERGLSVQYVIDRQGKVHQLMPDNAIAYHAGKNNSSNYNNKTSPGVEIIANDDSDVTSQQVEAAQRLVRSLADKYGFDPLKDVVGHGEVASHKRKTEGQTVLTKIRG